MRNKLLFLFLVSIFVFSRLYKIGQIPSSVYWDEASIGYNAYSILKTGRDEWGEFMPVHFRAFGEFKLPIYIYSTVPFVHYFGLSEVSVRMPSFFYSLFSLLIIFALVKTVFGSESLAFLSAFLFTVLPWDFIFSRTGYEASCGLFFFLLSLLIWFLFKPFDFKTKGSFGKKILFLLFYLFSLIFSIYSYNSFRFWSPLAFVFLLTASLIKKSGNLKYKLILFLISFLIISFSFYPIYRLYKFDYGSSRFQAVSLQGNFKEKTYSFVKNYLSHFSFDFLFLKGDSNLRSQMPGFGEIYVFSLPFIVLGFFYLLRRKDELYSIIIFLFLISPIPASLTKESPHSLRSILFAFVFPVLISLGIYSFISVFGRQKKIVLSIIVVSYLLFFGFYYSSFIRNYNNISSSEWQYLYKEVFVNRREVIEGATKVIVSDSYGQPYIFALFYNKFSPEEFRKTVKYNSPDKWGFSTIYSFDKFVFKKVDYQDLENGSIIFSDKEILGKDNSLIDKIVSRDGKDMLFVYKI